MRGWDETRGSSPGGRRAGQVKIQERRRGSGEDGKGGGGPSVRSSVGGRRLRLGGKRGTWNPGTVSVSVSRTTHHEWGGETTTASSDASGCSSPPRYRWQTQAGDEKAGSNRSRAARAGPTAASACLSVSGDRRTDKVEEVGRPG